MRQFCMSFYDLYIVAIKNPETGIFLQNTIKNPHLGILQNTCPLKESCRELFA